LVGQEEVVVREGDTLWDLAGRHLNDPYLWREIWEANRSRIADPNRIYPGSYVMIPGQGTVASNPTPPSSSVAPQPRRQVSASYWDKSASSTLSEFDWQRLENSVYKAERYPSPIKRHKISADLRLRAGILLEKEPLYPVEKVEFNRFFPGSVWAFDGNLPVGSEMFMVTVQTIELSTDTLMWARAVAEATVENGNESQTLRIHTIYDIPDGDFFWIPARQKFGGLECEYDLRLHEGPRVKVIAFSTNNLQSAGDFWVVAAGRNQRLKPGDILKRSSGDGTSDWLASLVLLNVYNNYSVGMVLATAHPLETKNEYVFQQYLKQSK